MVGGSGAAPWRTHRATEVVADLVLVLSILPVVLLYQDGIADIFTDNLAGASVWERLFAGTFAALAFAVCYFAPRLVVVIDRIRERARGSPWRSRRRRSSSPARRARTRLRRMGISDVIAKAADRIGAHEITTTPSERAVRVEHDGTVLAESTRAVELHESRYPTRFYIPREDVRMDLLERSETTTHCPFKGDATYYSGPGAQDAFWCYEQPRDDARPVGGMLCPWPGRVTVLVDGEPLAK